MQGIASRWLEAHRYPLTVLVASRLLVYFAIAAAGWTSRRPASAGLSYFALFSPLGRWDASWYRWIALHGYDRAGAHGHHANVVAFSPLYPLAYRVSSRLPGPMTLWGSLLSTLLFGVALCVLYDLGLQMFGRDAAARSVLYLAVCPVAFVFSLPYSESLYLAVTVAAFALTTRRPWAGGTLAALAVLARPIGVALVPALAWRIHRAGGRGRDHLPLLLPVAAQAAFSVYLAVHTGDSLAALHAQQHGWHRSLSVLPVVFAHTLWTGVLHTGSLAAAVEVGFTVLWCGLLFHAWRMRIPGEYLIYAALAVVIPTSAGTLLSIGRFGLVAFPLFWALADLGRSARIDLLVKIAFPVLLAASIFLTYGAASLTP
jgi:Gpi18-like mannosyltransferase